jgi:beta-lactamase regulating signal transducer with metallopeptidase domain
LTATFHYLIWTPLFIKLLLPTSFASSLSLFNYLPKLERAVPAEVFVPQIVAPAPGNAAVAVAGSAVSAPIDPLSILANVWVLGIILFVLTLAASYYATQQKVTRHAPSSHLQSLFSAAKQGKPFTKRTPLFITTGGTPFVFGFLRPAVVVPEEIVKYADQVTLQMVFDHELTHITRLDPLVRLLTLFLQAIHWFNPILWLAFAIMRRDCELACDEGVLAKYSAPERRRYGEVLLAMVDMGQNKINPLLAFSAGNIKNRVKNALVYKKAGTISIVLAAVLIIALAVALVPGAKQDDLKYTNLAMGETLMFPELWRGRYITTPVADLDGETFIEVFDKANHELYREEDPGFGWLFSILRVDEGRFAELWQFYGLFGGGVPIARQGEHVYLLLFPTDVRCDSTNEDLCNGYVELRDSVPDLVERFVAENDLTPLRPDEGRD